MPEPRSDVKWEYTDDIAVMEKRLAALEAEVAALKRRIDDLVLNTVSIVYRPSLP